MCGGEGDIVVPGMVWGREVWVVVVVMVVVVVGGSGGW